MDKQSRFYRLWLALGFIQMFALQGCMGSAPNEQLLSQSPPEAGGVDSAHSDSTQNVRLSRAFFERSLAGKMQVTPADGSPTAEFDSNVTWKEQLPAIREVGSVAPDHLGCASYEELGTRLCFYIMSDVTSVGINADEISAPSLGRAVAAADQSGCNANLQNLRFAQATKDGDSAVKVNFVGDRPAQEGCTAGPVMVTLELRQI